MIRFDKFRLRRGPPQLVCSVIAAGVAASVAGSVISGAMSGGAASSAGGQLLAGGKEAYSNMMAMLDRIQGQMQPYLDAGRVGANKLTDLVTNPQQALENLPGYQFVKQQGLKAVTNAKAMTGLGSSGSLLKGVGDYVTGLADTTYGSQFNRLLSMAGLGEKSSEAFGADATKIGDSANNFLTGGISGGAAGTVGAANAYGNAAQNAGSAIGNGIITDSIYGKKTGAVPGQSPWATQNGMPLDGGIATTGGGIPVMGTI